MQTGAQLQGYQRCTLEVVVPSIKSALDAAYPLHPALTTHWDCALALGKYLGGPGMLIITRAGRIGLSLLVQHMQQGASTSTRSARTRPSASPDLSNSVLCVVDIGLNTVVQTLSRRLRCISSRQVFDIGLIRDQARPSRAITASLTGHRLISCSGRPPY